LIAINERAVRVISDLKPSTRRDGPQAEVRRKEVAAIIPVRRALGFG
jgi:hypothetical protein